jgi:hypothetical protein
LFGTYKSANSINKLGLLKSMRVRLCYEVEISAVYELMNLFDVTFLVCQHCSIGTAGFSKFFCYKIK